MFASIGVTLEPGGLVPLAPRPRPFAIGYGIYDDRREGVRGVRADGSKRGALNATPSSSEGGGGGVPVGKRREA